MNEGIVLAHLQGALRSTLTILALRAFPVVVAFSASPSCGARARAIAVGSYTLVIYLTLGYADFDSTAMALAYCYLGVVAAIPYALSKVYRGRAAIFTLAFGLFMLVPAVLELRFRALLLVLGWDMMLSAYSYCVEKRARTSFAEYSFFVLVNPALVYGQRGATVSSVGFNGPGLRRVIGGCVAMAVSGVIPLGKAVFPGVSSGPLSSALGNVVVLAQIYCAHVGLAAIQIGLCRQLGIELPERYVQPFRASSPLEFWRRWNTYVGAWVRAYAFRPLALFLGRRFEGRGWTVLAVVLSFLCVGLLHDAYDSLLRRDLRLAGIAWFGLNGVIVVVWEIAARKLRKVRRSWAYELGARAALVVAAVALVGSFAYR